MAPPSSKDTNGSQLFSRIYLKRGAPARDSKRLRARLAAFARQLADGNQIAKFAGLVRAELGVDIPWSYSTYDLEGFFARAEIRDVLDSITLLRQAFVSAGWDTSANKLVSFVGRALHEENVGYRIDEAGVVHYHVDEEFERNRVSVLACLADPRFAGVAHSVESAYVRLDSDPPDTKAAVRDIFDALETLAKVITGSNKSLDAAFVKSALAAIANQAYEGKDSTAQGASIQLLHSLADWVNGAHKYRHGQNQPEPVAPPLELAILMLSQGAGFIRWLVELERHST